MPVSRSRPSSGPGPTSPGRSWSGGCSSYEVETAQERQGHPLVPGRRRAEHNDAGPSDGRAASRGIVCGAHNFAVGDFVVVALPGAVLPGGFAIAARKTYGHVSDGMICSARELGLGDDHAGIMVLTGRRAPGCRAADAAAVLQLRDDVLDIAVTPDRGYCLSIRGLARESAQADGRRLHRPGGPADPGRGGDGLPGPIGVRRPARCSSPSASPGSTRPGRARAGWPAGSSWPGCGRSRWPSTSPTT